MDYRLVMTKLDLEPIIFKAMDPEEGYGWGLEQAFQISEEYRKFLYLCITERDTGVVPSKQVNQFWHLHILDTQKYAEDCEKFVGYFLHHFPYFGMRGEQDAKNLIRCWEETKALYVRVFGQYPETVWSENVRCPNCGRRAGNGIYNEDRPRLPVAA